MERLMCDSPCKNAFTHESMIFTKSPSTFSTPVRQNDRKQRIKGFTSGINGLNVLPTHITPPSGLTKFIARNPFDADLTSRLHLSVISPTVFAKVSPSVHHDSPGFSWSVDELALIQPAKIEEFPLQQMHSTDPDIESVAQAAINKFFTDNQIIPSPWDNRNKNVAEKSEMHTPSRPLDELNLTREMHKTKKESWSQTVLSLPPVLPEEVEEALKPYFTFNQDQSAESEDANSSNNSLRRKLFFNHDDCTEDEEESSFCLSPRRTQGSMLLQSSPPQSGMLVHGTPLRGGAFSLQRTHGTPYAGNISPPNVSPICNGDMSCQSIRSRGQFAARLDFTTEMSIDQSARDDKELKRLEDIELETHTSMLRSNIVSEYGEKSVVKEGECAESDVVEAHNETAEMLSREATPLKNAESDDERGIKTSKREEIIDCTKIINDWCKIYSNDSCQQQNNTNLQNSCAGQQSYVNSAQDTGYQTHSISNITGNTENFSITGSVAKSSNWNEKILSSVDEIPFNDWKDNMKIMFSSTPSKYSRRRDN